MNVDIEEVESQFSCSIENLRSISEILGCLLTTDASKDHHVCSIEAIIDGLTFVSFGKAKSLQSRATLNKDLFEEYICEHESIKFCINLAVLLDCLRLFGSSENTSATMAYSSLDAIFRVSLEESGTKSFKYSLFLVFITYW